MHYLVRHFGAFSLSLISLSVCLCVCVCLSLSLYTIISTRIVSLPRATGVSSAFLCLAPNNLFYTIRIYVCKCIGPDLREGTEKNIIPRTKMSYSILVPPPLTAIITSDFFECV